mgnify:FL=1
MIKLYEPKIYKEDIELVKKTLEEGWISGNSPIVKDFENKLKEFNDVEHCLVTSSGTTALHLALLGCGLKKDDEVIMPTLSYIATANAVSYFGGKPIFVDVNKNDFQINIEKIEEKITEKTKAIMPVHLYGGVPNLDSIEEISKKYNLKIIHDSAEALGSLYKDKQSASFQDVGIISFFPNKVITTGEGGAILTNNKSIYDLSLKLRSQGLVENTDYIHDVIGYNYRISALSAALGYNQINKVSSHVKVKAKIFNTYKSELESYNISFQSSDKEVSPSYWLTVALFPEKIDIDEIQKFLKNEKIETRRVFYPLHLQTPYLGNEEKNLEISEEIYRSGLCLPTYPDLAENDLSYIIEKIQKFVS